MRRYSRQSGYLARGDLRLVLRAAWLSPREVEGDRSYVRDVAEISGGSGEVVQNRWILAVDLESQCHQCANWGAEMIRVWTGRRF